MHRVTYPKSAKFRPWEKCCEFGFIKKIVNKLVNFSFLKSDSYFQFPPYSVLVEMKVVRKDIMNIFELNDQFYKIYTPFSLQESLKLAKLSHFAEKIVFG